MNELINELKKTKNKKRKISQRLEVIGDIDALFDNLDDDNEETYHGS